MNTAVNYLIRSAEPTDFEGIWEIFRAVVKDGDTYAYGPDTSEEVARSIWLLPEVRTYVCVDENDASVVGAYLVKPQWPDLGSHVCTASFIVKPGVRGGGIGKLLGEHAIEEARRLGYLAMQFNLVVATNEPAVRLWRKLGFSTVGTLPKAFRHSKLGLVDAYVMYLELE
jgi:L-amino acid N-acyltransferase YncA